MIHYHPSIETLIDYASGSLTLTHSLCVSAHIEYCPVCQQQMAKLEALGAQLFDAEPTEHHQIDHIKNKVLEKITNTPNNTSNADQPVQTNQPKTQDHFALEVANIPRSLRQFIQTSYEELNWMKLSPSFKIATLYNEEGGAQVALTRVKAGAHMPTHTHTGDEITLVLKGAFSDKSGVYRQGDFISRDASHKHKPIVTKDSECICLTVLDAPIEFTGWLTRWLNPIIRRYHPHSRIPS